MIDRFHDEAQRTGAKIVLAAGVDSVPSDLGSQFAIEQLERRGARAAQVKALFTDYAGSFSGGTAKVLAALKQLPDLGTVRCGVLQRSLRPRSSGRGQGSMRETITGWERPALRSRLQEPSACPFFMAPINARIVRRSLALSGRLPCSYAEGLSVGAGLRASGLWISRGFGYFVGAPIPLSPKPGQGPPKWLQHAGKFCLVLEATSATGAHAAMVAVRGRGDPGYLATSKILGEVALCLVQDHEAAPRNAGVLTPWLALGSVLRERLVAAERGEFMQFRVLAEH